MSKYLDELDEPEERDDKTPKRDLPQGDIEHRGGLGIPFDDDDDGPAIEPVKGWDRPGKKQR